MFKFDEKTKENLADLVTKVGNSLKPTSKTLQGLTATAIGGAVALAIVVPIKMMQEPPVVDAEASALAEITFPEIQEAINNPGTHFVRYDEADRLDDIHALMLDADAETAEYRHVMRMGDAADLFNDVAQDGIFIKSYSCDLEQDGSYSCDLAIMEAGGAIAEGVSSESVVGSCQVRYIDVKVTHGDDGLDITAYQGDSRLNENRIAERYALAARVDLNAYTEESPHQGPQTLADITTSKNVNFHPFRFKLGGGFMGSLAEDQVAAERVFASFSDCLRLQPE